MNMINSKIYYDIKSGEVFQITSEMQGNVTKNTKEQDIEIYESLKNKNINDIDFIELEFGTLATIFTNIKSYKINLENKSLECEYFSDEELQSMQNQLQEQEQLNSRVSDISNYLSDQSDNIISSFEDFIIQTELNKITEGMN